MIASVVFRNFKALRNTNLQLAPFNLVIGPNGSGKSSLIQALVQLRTLSKLPLGDHSTPTLPSGAEISFAFSPPYEPLTASLGCVSELVCDLLRVQTPSPDLWNEVKARLTGIRSFAFNHGLMAAAADKSSGLELAADGRNLAAVLATQRDQSPALFKRFEDEVVRLLPEFTGFLITEAASGQVAFSLSLGQAEPPVAAENLSQGVLHLLGILVLAFFPGPFTLVGVEEIDRGVHPRLLREVRDALYRLSYPASFGETRPAVQVIATTHSPYLLDLFREHPEEVVITQKEGREARFERLADRQDLKELLREGSLGDMWYSGILGGVPEAE